MYEKTFKQPIRVFDREFFQYDIEKFFGLIDNYLIGDLLNRSSNVEIQHNMTRKTNRTQKQLSYHSRFQPGYCAICHIPYNCLVDHIQSKRHLKLIGEDANFITTLNSNGFDDDHYPFLNLNVDVNDKNSDHNFPRLTKKMPRTRSASINDRIKDSSMSPGSDNNNDSNHHHLRSRKNINYMTPPLEDDTNSLSDKPEIIKEYRELRSSTRLLAKLTEQITESDDVWNSGRPKRSCNKSRYSADERLVVDNKSYYKVEVLPTKLRSGGQHNSTNNCCVKNETHLNNDCNYKKKLRNSELTQLNSEAENFLFPKKEDSDDDDDNDNRESDKCNNVVSSDDETKKIRNNDDSRNCNSVENKTKKRRRTHAEAFIRDNQKYYKFETPGSSTTGKSSSSASSSSSTSKHNGDCAGKHDSPKENIPKKEFKINLDDYNFSFETIPKREHWYQTFERRDNGNEKYSFLSDYNYWDPLILPYQVNKLPPLNPKECINQYNQIIKCLSEQPSSSSNSCTTPDPSVTATTTTNTSSSVITQDEDSKISTTLTELSSTTTSSTLEEIKLIQQQHMRKKPGPKPRKQLNTSGRNPRKSPRQHASTLAILSLLHQRKRKSRSPTKNLPTIEEEKSPVNKKEKPKIDYFTIARNIDEELSRSCEYDLLSELDSNNSEEGISFSNKIDIIDLINCSDQTKLNCKTIIQPKKIVKCGTKAGRKPGRKKKNRTGWPNNNNNRRHLRKIQIVNNVDNVEEVEEDNSTDSIINNNDKKTESEDENSDLDRVSNNNNKKVNNNSETNEYCQAAFVRVQKLKKKHIVNKVNNCKRKKTTIPKRTNRGQRRMPASPKSPRMLRRPRGRWYRER